MSFTLDARLEADTLLVGELPLCRVLLMNDARFLWLVLVPRRAGLVEIVDLEAGERATLIEEIVLASEALGGVAALDKINVGALGNIVSQLHVHVVARRIGDDAWPGPVWGAGERRAYEEGQAPTMVSSLKLALMI